MLETYLHKRIKKKDILIMTHVVLGYPSFDDCFRTVEAMVEARVDLMELQIPFSDPMADGPVIARANQRALEKGATVRRCLDFAQRAAEAFDIPFLIMSYYNLLHKYGVERFISALARRRLRGAIIPDLPPEEGKDYLEAMREHNLAPVLFFSPGTSEERMRIVASLGGGFIYCVARKGVTGTKTVLSEDVAAYLERCRLATRLPLAVGFGIRERVDIDFLRGKADIAVVGSKTIEIAEKQGIKGVKNLLRSLR